MSMPFSDTTNKDGIIQHVEQYLNFPDGYISGNNSLLSFVTSLVNEATYEVIDGILKSQDDFNWDDTNNSGDDLPVGTKALTTNRYIRLDSTLNLLTVRRVDVTYDGTNWYKAQPIETGALDFALGNDDHVDGRFSLAEPKYDLRSNDLLGIYPRANSDQVTAGAKARIEFTRNFDEFTSADTTQEPPVARPYRELIPMGASMKYKVIKGLPGSAELKVLWDEKIANMKDFYSHRNERSMTFLNPVMSLSDYS